MSFACRSLVDLGHPEVLVHCMVGASRSVSLVLAWLVARQRIPLREAFKQVGRLDLALVFATVSNCCLRCVQ